MHFHVENYEHESIFALTAKDDILKGQALKHYIDSIGPLRCNPGLGYFDFTDFSDHANHNDLDGMHWYGDGERIILEVKGENIEPGGVAFFRSIVGESIKLMHKHMPNLHLETMTIADTHVIALNHYNVIVALRGRYNRMLVFSIGDAMANQITEIMLAEPIAPEERQALIRASISELSNMIVGLSLKHIIPLETLRMSIPMCFEAPKSHLVQAHEPLRLAMCATCGEAFKVYGVNFFD